jgi:hypothetical protein
MGDGDGVLWGRGSRLGERCVVLRLDPWWRIVFGVWGGLEEAFILFHQWGGLEICTKDLKLHAYSNKISEAFQPSF